MEKTCSTCGYYAQMGEACTNYYGSEYYCCFMEPQDTCDAWRSVEDVMSDDAAGYIYDDDYTDEEEEEGT